MTHPLDTKPLSWMLEEQFGPLTSLLFASDKLLISGDCPTGAMMAVVDRLFSDGHAGLCNVIREVEKVTGKIMVKLDDGGKITGVNFERDTRTDSTDSQGKE